MIAGRVAIVGGGVIGAACAHYLVNSGWSVTILECGQFGMGCSHGNCGFVCPSHVLPLAEPGAAWKALKALFHPNSPFAIKPRFDPGLWLWLLRFASRCNHGDMMQSARAIHAILQSSMTLYRELLARESLECEWEMRGLLFVFRSQAEMDAYASTDKLLREEFNEPAVRYDGAAVNQLEPALQNGLAGGWHYESDAHLRPDKLIASWRRVLENRGVVIRENCHVRGFQKAGGRLTAVKTSHGNLAADAFVIATGALAPMLGRDLGCRLPIQPGKGYSITMPRPAVCPTIPLIFPETRVAVTPMQSGYRLGSTMEFASYDSSIHPNRLRLLTDGARPYLQVPVGQAVLERWYGWRPMTFDSKPIIGPVRDFENVIVAAGHSMLGLSMATGTGKLVAEILNGEKPHIDPTPYSPNRF